MDLWELCTHSQCENVVNVIPITPTRGGGRSNWMPACMHARARMSANFAPHSLIPLMCVCVCRAVKHELEEGRKGQWVQDQHRSWTSTTASMSPPPHSHTRTRVHGLIPAPGHPPLIGRKARPRQVGGHWTLFWGWVGLEGASMGEGVEIAEVPRYCASTCHVLRDFIRMDNPLDNPDIITFVLLSICSPVLTVGFVIIIIIII